MRRFIIEHEFRAPSLEAFWDSLVDAEHQAEIDAATGLASRTSLEDRHDGPVHVRRFRVVPARELPGWLRRVTGVSLAFEERSELDRDAGEMRYQARPETLGGRVDISGVYRVVPAAPGRVRRTFAGSVEARIPLVGGRIEAAVVDDMEASYQVAQELTQAYLDALAGSPPT